MLASASERPTRDPRLQPVAGLAARHSGCGAHAKRSLLHMEDLPPAHGSLPRGPAGPDALGGLAEPLPFEGDGPPYPLDA